MHCPCTEYVLLSDSYQALYPVDSFDTLFQEEIKGMKKRGREVKKSAADAKVPEKPPSQGPGRSVNTSFFFTKYVMEGRTHDRSREEDPREALIKLNELAKSDPMYLGGAYASTQPVPILQEMTFEEEQEDFKKRQKQLANS